MKLKKPISLFALVAILVISPAISALAQDGSQPTDEVAAMVLVNGRPLSVQAQPITFESVTLTGVANAGSGLTDEWLANDPTGMGAGWRAEIQATGFVAQDNASHIIPVSGLAIHLDSGTINAKPGVTSAPPVSLAGGSENYAPVSMDFLPLLSTAADTGMGLYGITPVFNLTIPASTYVGTYVSMVTVSIVSSP